MDGNPIGVVDRELASVGALVTDRPTEGTGAGRSILTQPSPAEAS